MKDELLKEWQKMIGAKCKDYRMHELKISLSDMEYLTGTSKQTLSSFENGKSTNIQHLLKYCYLCDEEQKDKLLNMLFKREKNND